MTKGNDMRDLGAFSDVLADDRVLDAIGRGEHVSDVDSPLYALLSSAREEAEASVPAPPNLGELLGEEYAPQDSTNVTSISSRRRGSNMRRHARAAAAGGLSVTSMFVAGGVAAALAIGGLGYAAYNGTLPTRETPQNVQADAGDSSSQSSSSVNTQTNVQPPEPVAPREEASAPEPPVVEPSATAPVAPTPEPVAPTDQPQPAPLPEGQVLAEGQGAPGAEGAAPAGEMGVMMGPGAAAPTTTEDEDGTSSTSTTSPRPGGNGQNGPLDGRRPGAPIGATDTTR